MIRSFVLASSRLPQLPKRMIFSAPMAMTSSSPTAQAGSSHAGEKKGPLFSLRQTTSYTGSSPLAVFRDAMTRTGFSRTNCAIMSCEKVVMHTLGKPGILGMTFRRIDESCPRPFPLGAPIWSLTRIFSDFPCDAGWDRPDGGSNLAVQPDTLIGKEEQITHSRDVPPAEIHPGPMPYCISSVHMSTDRWYWREMGFSPEARFRTAEIFIDSQG